MTGFIAFLIPALIAYAIGLLVAWFIWGGDRSEA